MIIDTPVIDFHTHAGSWGATGVYDDPDRFLRIMDAAGVDRSCINCIFFGDARRSNDTVTKFLSKHPDRFVGVAFVTPHYPNEVVPELERAFGELGMRSLKVYPTYFGRPIDDPAYTSVFEWCDQRNIVVMSHSSFTGPEDTLTAPVRFIKLAERFPHVQWVLAHSGNSMQGQIQAVEAAQARQNIYLETATSFGEHGTIEYLVEGAGEDKVLFGSDMPLLDARHQVGRIVTADISDEAKRKVLGLNAIRILGL